MYFQISLHLKQYFVIFFSRIADDNHSVFGVPAASASGPVLCWMISHLPDIFFLFIDLFIFQHLWANVKLFVTLFSGNTVTDDSHLMFCVHTHLGIPFCFYQFHTCATPFDTFCLPTWHYISYYKKKDLSFGISKGISQWAVVHSSMLDIILARADNKIWKFFWLLFKKKLCRAWNLNNTSCNELRRVLSFLPFHQSVR